MEAGTSIGGRQYVLDSDWGDVQPDAEAGDAFLGRHAWQEYAASHLGLTVGTREETKACYGFVYVDFRRVTPQRPHRLCLPGSGVAP